MKIVFLSDDFPPQSFGGAGISTFELAVAMQQAGHQVSVITTCRHQTEAGESNSGGLPVFKIASDYSSRWRAYLSLYNPPVIKQLGVLLKNINPDVVHVNNVHFYLSYYSIKLAKRYSKVVVFTARDAMAFSFGKLQTKKYLTNLDAHLTWLDHWRQAKKRWNPLRNFFIRWFVSYADQIFAVSQALKRALEQNGFNNIIVAHTGIDVESWEVDQVKLAEFRKKYDLENKEVVLFGGRLSAAKGGGQALEALAVVAAEIPTVVMLVVGQIDRYAERMRQQASALGLENHLIFTGWTEREEIKYTYASADVVVVPSICFDAFPRLVLEAMACGKPVIGTRYGGVPEIIVDGVTGYVVDPLQVKDVADKVVDLLRQPNKSEHLGRVGRERVQTRFNLGAKVDQILIHYQRLCGLKK